jgi:hypothetical protein
MKTNGAPDHATAGEYITANLTTGMLDCFGNHVCIVTVHCVILVIGSL